MLKDHLNKLEYYCLVIENGSLLQTSRRYNIGQPQLSKIIKVLEEDIGETLLIRSKTGIKPTSSGSKLYKASKAIISTINQTDLSIRSSNQILTGHIFIGTYDSISRYFFPDFLHYIGDLMPEINVQLETGQSKYILSRLRKNEIDLAISAQEHIKSKSYISKVVFDDHFSFYKSPHIKELFETQIIYDPYSINDQLFSPDFFGFKKILLSENLETVKALTEKGLGIGLLPTKVAYDGVIKNQLVPSYHQQSENKISEHQIYLTYKKKNLNPVLKIVLAELERFLEMWLRK